MRANRLQRPACIFGLIIHPSRWGVALVEPAQNRWRCSVRMYLAVPRGVSRVRHLTPSRSLLFTPVLIPSRVSSSHPLVRLSEWCGRTQAHQSLLRNPGLFNTCHQIGFPGSRRTVVPSSPGVEEGCPGCVPQREPER